MAKGLCSVVFTRTWCPEEVRKKADVNNAQTITLPAATPVTPKQIPISAHFHCRPGPCQSVASSLVEHAPPSPAFQFVGAFNIPTRSTTHLTASMRALVALLPPSHSSNFFYSSFSYISTSAGARNIFSSSSRSSLANLLFLFCLLSRPISLNTPHPRLAAKPGPV